MLRIISPENKGLFKKDLDNYFRIRKKILIDQLCWDLKSVDGKEIDQFDHDQAHYLLYKSSKAGKVIGGVRLTPSTGQSLTLNVFSNLIDPQKEFLPSPQVWECSRFVIDFTQEKIQATLIKEATLMLFIGMVEYGLSHNIHSYIATTEVRLERVIRMAQWSLERLGKVEKIGNTYAVPGLLEVSKRINKRIRERAGIMGNVFRDEGAATYGHL
jgi:acyl homoserine lactone synthase